MQRFIRESCIELSSPRKRRFNYSYDEQEYPSTSATSPAKVENSYSKNLVKNQLRIESNIYKYRSIQNRTKATETNSYERYASRKSSLSGSERIQVLSSMERGYSLLKTINSRPKNIRLSPISKTIEINKSPTKKAVVEQISELKNRNVHMRNQKLDVEIREDGKLAPLRLILSNKIRNKIIRDLLTSEQQTKQNVQNILERQNEHEWLPQFEQLKRSIDAKQEEQKRRHNKQLVSKRPLRNAYYQFLALNNVQKQELLRKQKKRKMQKYSPRKEQQIAVEAKPIEEQISQNIQSQTQISEDVENKVYDSESEQIQEEAA